MMAAGAKEHRQNKRHIPHITPIGKKYASFFFLCLHFIYG
jgi:hypothetical protein